MFLDYLQGYSMPEILNRIHILWLSAQGYRPAVVLALPVGDQFGTMTWLTVIRETEWILEQSYANSTTHFSSIPIHLVTLTVPATMSNFTMRQAAPDHDLQKMLHCQIQALLLGFFSRKPS